MIRALDLLISSIALLLLCPLLLPVMGLLRLTGEGKVFYLQERIGKGGTSFLIIKFATMRGDSTLGGGPLTQRNDPRVLPVGRVLRYTKINELPQLVNVWLGQMSMVGPRPVPRIHYDLYSFEQKAAIAMNKPGLTGLGSLVFRNEAGLLERSGEKFDHFHNRVIAPYKGELEHWYANRASLRAYFKILLLTTLSLIKPNLNLLRFFPDAPRPSAELQEILPS